MSLVRFTGKLVALGDTDRRALVERSLSVNPALEENVRKIVAEVRAEGDAALERFARAFDKTELAAIEVPNAELARALGSLDPVVRAGLERAATNLETVARASLPAPTEIEVEPGVVVGRRFDPLARVGVYAPGGKAAYPSSVLMGVVPAKIAGVREVVVCSPPGPNGLPSDVVLAAAAIAGADKVLAIGGAGAIAALAYGTESIGKVDRIVGPGNAWVAEAKRQVSSDVGIDAPAGPSEILIVADSTASPEAIARELLAQAEHDEDACVVALCLGDALARKVIAAVEKSAPLQPRKDIVLPALASRGAVLVIDTLEEAWPFVEAFAPEHLFLALADADADGALSQAKNAGTVFVGHSASVAFGDYLTGANHVLPTAGAARRASGLSVTDFVRATTWQRLTPAGAAAMAATTDALAQSEGLFAHADAARGHASLDAKAPAPAPVRPRRGVETIARYVPKRPPCAIDLTDNTNLFGAPPSVAKTLTGLASSAITRYPSPYGDELRSALGTAFGVPVDCIATGDGSDDVIDTVTRAFGDPGDVFAFCPPTFSIVASFATANGLRPEACPLDVAAIARKNPKIVYLCAPNNPTGALLPDGFLDAVLEKTRALVLYDEAYADYSGVPSLVARAATSDRIVVARTFSKAYGLAGLRVGWAVSSPAIIANVERARGPYKVGAVAEKAALAALSDRAWVEARVNDVLALRSRFIEALVAKGLAPLPSAANFVLVPVANCEARADAMRAHGVSVRAFPKLVGIGDALRISLGPWPMLEACLGALEATR